VDFSFERRGVIMQPDPENPEEAWGVLNPATATGPDGKRYLLPRLVAEKNYSRVGLCELLLDDNGDPSGVKRLGSVLEPVELWEHNALTAGVEDPRVVFMDVLEMYVMTYAAYGPLGSRTGLAVSTDLREWRRLGPVLFAYDPALGTDLNLYPNKDAIWFPEPVPGPDGQPSLAVLHRPTWGLKEVSPYGFDAVPKGVSDPRPGIWVSFVPVAAVKADITALTLLRNHQEVAVSQEPWELLKIGGGTPPVRIPEGWLTVFHGVSGRYTPGTDLQQHVHYKAGVMIHDSDDVTKLIYRSPEPLLEPELVEERDGIVPNVVFPTALDLRDDNSADVFYGMADSRIGWAKLRW
jgi:predicted GH43/DUF377 family glycosyl hydrolase